ncbi:glycosyltransferase family 4 protein [Halorubrum sp. JWXQ-INN 858]|uniref:glycosyltransferase family 4 protein n=1 Tax=Halorubrum sp. JWXQ-INN 858 TaxID=2690782 RepID=UPI0031B71A11
MRVLNYLELADPLQRSGIGTAARQQRRALRGAAADLDVIESPWRGGDPRVAAAGLLRGRPPIREFDLAHCNLFGPGSVAVARTARRRDVPLICHAHSTGEDFAGSFRGSTAVAPALRRYLRWFYSLADLVLAPSEYAAELLAANGVDVPVRAISNGVDLASLSGHERLRTAYRDRFGFTGTVVFTVGNVFERKGLTDFCLLAEELANAESDREFRFAWFGPYDDGPRASSTVRRWTTDPPANVTFTGWVEDKRGAFAAGDVYLFATKEETQGIAALEAMACGKPCVLRDLPVFREYYTDGEDCLLAESRAEMREAVTRIAADPDLARRLGRNARETAERHGLDVVGAELSGIYADLLEGRMRTREAMGRW